MKNDEVQKFVDNVLKEKNTKAEALLEKILKEKVANRLNSVLKN